MRLSMAIGHAWRGSASGGIYLRRLAPVLGAGGGAAVAGVAVAEGGTLLVIAVVAATALAAISFAVAVKPSVLLVEAPVIFILLATLNVAGTNITDLTADPLAPTRLYKAACIAAAGALSIAALLGTRSHPDSARVMTRPLRLYVGYVFVALIGIGFSAMPTLTALAGIEVLVNVLVVVAAYRVAGPESVKRVGNLLYWYAVLLTATVWLNVIAVPSLAIDRVNSPIPWQIQGVLPAVSSNTIGTLAVVIIFWSVARMHQSKAGEGFSRKLAGMMIAYGLITLVAAQYRTGYAALLIVGVLYLLVRRRAVSSLVLALVTIAAITFGPSLQPTVEPYALRGADPTQAARLSGRAGWWSLALPVWRQSPYFGRGLDAGTRLEVLSRPELGRNVENIHGAWVEALVGTGIVGVFFLGASLLVAWKRALTRVRLRPQHLAPLLLLAVLTVRSLTGNGLQGGGDSSLLYLTILMSLRDPPEIRPPL